MTLTPREKRIVELTKLLVRAKTDKLPPHPFGHGFLWGIVQIRRAQKNGKIREFGVKTLLASICVESYTAAQAVAENIPGVTSTWVNPD